MQSTIKLSLLALAASYTQAHSINKEAEQASSDSAVAEVPWNTDHWKNAYNKSETNYHYGPMDDDEDDEVTKEWINNPAHWAINYNSYKEIKDTNNSIKDEINSSE